MADEFTLTVFDAALAAIIKQDAEPDRNGGGLIGRAAAVVNALGIDGDAPLSKVRPKAPAASPTSPTEEAP